MIWTTHWRHDRCDCASNHQPHDCLLNHLFIRRSNKTSKLRVTGLCAWNSPVTGEFRAQMATNAENVSIWWRYHANTLERNFSSASPIIMARFDKYSYYFASARSWSHISHIFKLILVGIVVRDYWVSSFSCRHTTQEHTVDKAQDSDGMVWLCRHIERDFIRDKTSNGYQTRSVHFVAQFNI